MSDSSAPSPSADASDLLAVEHDGAVTHLRLNRPAKRNALNDALIGQPAHLRRPARGRRARWC